MIDEETRPYYLNLDRAHAAMIMAVKGEGEYHEALYHILEALSHDDRQRAEGVIPALEFEIDQHQLASAKSAIRHAGSWSERTRRLRSRSARTTHASG